MTRTTGKRALMEQLVADGVRYIFGNPGTTEQAFMDVLQDYPQLEFILCLHEGVAVAMADTYARAIGKPAFVELHIAPGLGNAGGMLFNAKSAHTPLVVYVGQSPSAALFQEPHLSDDLVAIAEPLTKWAYQVEHAADVPQALRRAFKVAEDAPQGPVVLAIPIDVMDEEADVTVTPTTFTRWRAHPDPGAIEEAAALIRAGARPLIVVGDGVALSSGQEGVARLAELIGAPIYHGYSSEINVALDHPLLFGTLPFTSSGAPAFAQRLLARHDVVIVVGTPFLRFIFPSAGHALPADLKVIQIDVDGWEIGKNLPHALGIKADCRAALAALLERLEPNPPPGARERVDALTKESRSAREEALAADRRGWDDVPITVPRLMSEIATALPKDATIFEEPISAGGVLARYLTPRPGRYFRGRGGGVGSGMPGPIALKLAMPERPAIGVVADGSAMYTISALWTAAHHRVPVTWIIINNASYRILKQNLVEYLGPSYVERKFVGLDLDEPPLRFDRLAEAMGVRGWRVERPEEIRPLLREALALGAPALLDVVVDAKVR